MIDAPPPTSEPSPTTTPGRDPALDHRGAERAGVEVDEALVHDGGARRRGARRGGRGRRRRCARPVGTHVVDHPRELVDAEHLHRCPCGAARSRVCSKPSTAHGPTLVQTTLGSTPKMPSRLSPCGRDEPVRQQVQAQVGVGGVGRRCRRGRSRRARSSRSRRRASSRAPVGAGQRRELVLGGAAPVRAERGRREPGVEHPSGTGPSSRWRRARSPSAGGCRSGTAHTDSSCLLRSPPTGSAQPVVASAACSTSAPTPPR